MDSNAAKVKDETLEREAAAGIQVCAVCLTTSNLSPLRLHERHWLSTSLGRPPPASLACMPCGAALKRAARLALRTKHAMETLLCYGAEPKTNIRPFIPLTTTHLGSNHFDFEYEDNRTTFVEIVKEEPDIKYESVECIEWSDCGVSYTEIVNEVKKPPKKTPKSKPPKRRPPKSDNDSTDSEDIPIAKAKEKLKAKIRKKASVKKTVSSARKRQIEEKDRAVKSLFEMKELTLDEQKADIVKRQSSSNYQNSPYTCGICFKGFKDAEASERHATQHSEAAGPLACALCHLRFANSQALYKHTTRLHRYRYTCRKCGTVVKSRTEAVSHTAWHAGKKFVCDVCGQEFAHQNTYLGHKRIKHPTGEHVCALCGFSFNNEKGRAFHTLRRHPGEDQAIPPDGPECVPCGIRFRSGDALAMHERVSPRHGASRRNEPQMQLYFPGSESGRGRRGAGGAGKARVRPTERGTWSRKDPWKEPIACEQCGALQTSSWEYSMHFAKHHSTVARTVFPEDASPCLCSVCGRTFKSAAMLRIHLRSHSDKQPRGFECSVCSKRFQWKGQLEMHMNTHTRAKPYACAECGRTFSHIGNRTRHQLVHLEAKNFKCEFCDKHFKCRKDADAHAKHVHLKVPWPKRNRQRTDGARGVKNRVVPPGTEFAE